MPRPPDDPSRFALYGVVHLLALPGAPLGSPGRQAVLDRALRDAEALVRGGVEGCVVENFGDAPFPPGDADPHVPAFLAVAADRLRREFGDALQVGVNALRNDARAALAAAAAAGASFVRVNVLAGAAWTDQGLVQGRAAEVLAYRRSLGHGPGSLRIFADVFVKHARPLGWTDIGEAAADTALRAGADALIVTGAATGRGASLADARRVRAAAPRHPLWVGSGVRPDTLADWVAVADGAIVGTFLHEDADLRRPLDPDRVAALVEARRQAGRRGGTG